MTGTTYNYAGRQLDIELLQHVEKPVDQRVFPSIDHDMDEVVSGLRIKLGRQPTEEEINQGLKDYAELHGSYGPKICAGMEKVVQRYAKLLLTDEGTVKFSEDIGGEIVSSIRRGEVSSEAYMTNVFATANKRAVTAMMVDDESEEMFGSIPDDERIESAELVDLVLDEVNATVRIHVRITTMAGESYEYVVPVAAGIS